MLGGKFGGHADYVTVPQDGAVTGKPANLTFEEAAALVFGGITAQTFLGRTSMGPGRSVLVNGASGAVGTAAVQLANIAGAHVTAVCSGANTDLVRSLGAETVIDYTKEDFTQSAAAYDVIVDCVSNVPFRQLQPLIKPGGAVLSVIADLVGVLAAGVRSRRTGTHITAGNVPFIAADLGHIAQLAETGQFRPVIERAFDLGDIAEAHRHVSAGRKRGNVVVRVAVPSTQESSAETR